MIKVLWFSNHPEALGVRGLPAVDVRTSDGLPLAPVRCTRNLVLTDGPPADPPHRVIDTATFEDLAHADRFRRAIEGDVPHSPYDPGTIAVATEVVARGEEWLTARWLDDATSYKHMALARRADGLSRDEFAERWKAHAGAAGATPIPDELRGLAYVQNHASLGGTTDAEPSYDAINEVWFDDLDLLRARHRWLAENLPPPNDDDLFGERHLLLVEEQVVFTR